MTAARTRRIIEVLSLTALYVCFPRQLIAVNYIALENWVHELLVDLESDILEFSVPAANEAEQEAAAEEDGYDDEQDEDFDELYEDEEEED